MTSKKQLEREIEQLERDLERLKMRVKSLEFPSTDEPRIVRVPDGEYRAIIKRVESKTAMHSGRVYWQLMLQITGSPSNGAILFHNMLEHPPSELESLAHQLGHELRARVVWPNDSPEVLVDSMVKIKVHTLPRSEGPMTVIREIRAA